MIDTEEGAFKNVIDKMVIELVAVPMYEALCNRDWYEVDEGKSVSSAEVKPRIDILDKFFGSFIVRMRASELADSEPGLEKALNTLHFDEFYLAWSNYRKHLNTKDPEFINVYGFMTCEWIGLEKKLLNNLLDTMCTYLRYERGREP